MNNTKFLFVIILSVINFFNLTISFAQTSIYSDVQITSPTAASLGKYADIPVNYHTGIPQISIPLYTVKEGPLSLPISLSYHAGGIKVMEPAGWCGIGWALNAGGVISRTVRGTTDEASNTGIGQYGHFKDYGFSNYLMIGPPRPFGTGAYPNDLMIATNQYDGEPDLFFFNFNGHAGKFYFQDDRSPVVVDGEDLRIEYYYPKDTMPSYTLSQANIQGFIITIANGDKYYFGINPGINSGVDAIEMTFPYSTNHQNVSDRTYSSWYLTKIISADGLFSINFTYQAESYSYYTISMYPIDPHTPRGTYSNPFAGINNIEYALVKNYVEGVRLSKIYFSNGSVDFTPSDTARTDLSQPLSGGVTFADGANTQAKALQYVTVSDGGGVCKKYQLFCNYFSDNISTLPTDLTLGSNIQSDKYRLRLDSIREQTCDGSENLPPYQFEYYANFLPRRLSFAQDHWGFYNGATANNNIGLIPTYTKNTYIIVNGADRDAKWPEMQSGALTKIIYPTGGSSIFEFEAHTTHVQTIRYNEVYRGAYSVGYDGNPTPPAWTNVAFSGNPYKIVLTNGPCPASYPNCGAGIHIKNSSNVEVAYVSADGNSSSIETKIIPAGNYSITMTRNAVGTVNGAPTGAQATLYEIVPLPVNENTLVGGLRIKKITADDNIIGNDDVITTYNYDFNGYSTGILYSRPRYVQIIRNDLVKQFGLAPPDAPIHQYINGCMNPEGGPPSPLFTYFVSPSPILPMTTSQGNHIGYNEVTVTQAGNGRSVYRYYGSGIWDDIVDDVAYRNVDPGVCDPAIPVMPAAPPVFEYKRGELKQEEHYNQDGSLLKSVMYFIYYDSTRLSTPGYIVWKTASFIIGNQYSLRGYWKNKTEKIISESAPGIGTLQTTVTTFHESAFHHQPTREVTINSRNETLETKIKYAADYRISACDNISSCISTYISACNSCDAAMAAATSNCSTIQCKYYTYIDNLICRANARAALINCRKTNFTNTNNAFKTCIVNAKNNADAHLKPILELQQAFNNPQIEISRFNNTKLVSSNFIRYDYVTNPAGKVYPSVSQQINLTGGSSTFTASTTSANNTSVTKDSRYTDENTIKVYAGNPVELTSKTGIPRAYIWDYAGNHSVAEVVNAAVADIAYTSFESDGRGNWTCSGSSVAVPYAHTGTKVYDLSSGNIYKPIHITTTYILSYWRPVNSSALTIPGTITGYPTGGRMVNGWKHYEHKISGQSIAIISGNGHIDDLRLYPENAQMTTYTYDPLIGMTSRCDANNRITYYEYDGLGRLSLVRDQDKNILRRICYNYAGQPEDCNNGSGSGTAPLAPGDLIAVAPGSSVIKVGWVNNAANATNIELYRSHDGNSDYILLAHLSPQVHNYNDTAL
ncbi:MAG TPA: hypothetical protein PLL71_06505, partial [Agriterribacter sp.]|nr:hypothetical protein [Agriterribacter sp.]